MKLLSAAVTSLVLAGTLFAQSVTLQGNKVALSGTEVNVGDKAPVVTLVDKDLKEIKVGGKTDYTQVFVVVPSIDTPICDLEARTFNKKASEFENTKIYVISMDLPFAAQRYCAAKGIDNITVASDFQSKSFGKAYGTLLGEGVLKGIEARVIFVVKEGKVTYKQLVPEIKQKPDFEAALDAIK